MAKQVITLAPDLIPDKPRRRKLLMPILSLCVMAPLLAPIAIDAASLCYAQWRELLGSPVDIRTPTLDAIGEHLAEAREVFHYHVSSRFHRVPWNPRIVVPAAIVVMVVAVLMIRL